jgi:glycosyltransferase involved in cell wall biosynthesis
VVELPHPHAEEDERGPLPLEIRGQPAVVFTGAIYDAQAEGVRRLMDALESDELAQLDPRVYLLTQSRPADLSQWGICPSDRVTVAASTRLGARAAQRAADVLFLPIAFDTKRDVRRTASPSKLPEYLASGVPILVYAPPDSFIAKYALAKGFAEVVTVADADELARALRRVASNDALRTELLRRARETLRQHDASVVAETLRQEVAAAVPETSSPRTVVKSLR